MGLTGWLLVGWLVIGTLGYLAGAWAMDTKRRDEAIGEAANASFGEALNRAAADDKLDSARAALAETWRLYEADRIHLPGAERARFLELMGKADAARAVRS